MNTVAIFGKCFSAVLITQLGDGKWLLVINVTVVKKHFLLSKKGKYKMSSSGSQFKPLPEEFYMN